MTSQAVGTACLIVYHPSSGLVEPKNDGIKDRIGSQVRFANLMRI